MAIIKATIFLAIFMVGSISSTPWTIIANGPATAIEAYMSGRKTVVLDGAINRFKDLAIYPDCMLGDFDCIDNPAFWGMTGTFTDIDKHSPPYTGNFGITIVPAKDQNHTDLEKGILYCEKEGASSIYIVQADGGRMDHTLANLGLLRKHYRPECEMILFTEKEQIFYIRDGAVNLEDSAGETCAILGYPEAEMTTSGLAYNGSAYPLKFGISESVCNTIVEPFATISIKGEALIILSKSSKFRKEI